MDKFEQAVGQARDPRARVHALNDLISELARSGHGKQAERHVDEVQRTVATLDDDQLKAETLHAVARCHFYLADFPSALELLFKAAHAYRSAGDVRGAADALAGVGLCQHRIGAQEDAIQSLLQALDTALEHHLQPLQIAVHNSLGSAYIAANQLGEAERYLREGVALAERNDDKNLLTKLLLNQALLCRKYGELIANDRNSEAHGEWEAGLELAQRALATSRLLANRYDEAHCVGLCGVIQRLLGLRDAAQQSLVRALALGRELDEAYVQAEAHLELGRLAITHSNASAASDHLRDAIGIAERVNARAILGEACEAFSAHCEASGDLKSALLHYKRYHGLREEELASTRARATRALELWREFERATRETRVLQAHADSLAVDKQILERRTDELEEASDKDPLTGLLNRRALDSRMEAVVTASRTEEMPVTVAIIDIDYFKRINDHFSHSAGDAVLRRVSQVIREHCRAGDLPVRYGGDEFLLVLLGVGSADAHNVLRRLKSTIDATSWSDIDQSLSVALSIGVATFAPGTTVDATIRAADRALYEAKAKGRNCIVCAGAP